MREPGFYWVRRYTVPYIAEWGGGYWYLPGISDKFAS